MITATTLPAIKHGIDNQDISQNALDVVQQLQEAGFQAYLVGGCVRDLLLHRKPKDFDVTTEATPNEIKKLFRNSRIIGRRFKLVHVRFGYEVIEVATFRADAGNRDQVHAHQMSEGEQGQLTRDNVYGTLQEDVARRDFTVNALYYDSVKQEVHDFMDSIKDIENKQLRSIGEPHQRFREDPVRMLRIIRFAAKLGFEMEAEALDMVANEGKLLSHVSPARLFEEVLKLFHGGAAHDTFQMLRKHNLFQYLFPFTEQCIVENTEGMPERALKNTDKRVAQSKPVIPAFLFACMMWDPVRTDAQVLMDSGTKGPEAWRIAMNDALRDQSQYVAVPRRLSEIILDIWDIQFRLIKRNPRLVKACMGNRRFRAAYDFLLLRADLHEVDKDIADWWTRIQQVDEDQQQEMIDQLADAYQGEGAHHSQGEANGNSINYNSGSNGNSYNNSGSNRNSNRRGGSGKNSHGYKKKGYHKKRSNPRIQNAQGTGQRGYQSQESVSEPTQTKRVKIRKKRRAVDVTEKRKSRSRHPAQRNRSQNAS